jgi:hypothetical protein
VYVGHAAIALALTAWRPRTSVALAALAAYGPDWVETAAIIGGIGPPAAESLSHSLVGLAIGAAVAGLLAGAVRGHSTGWTIAIAWLSHWPADFVTAYKPLFDREHLVGLDFYSLPAADFSIEALLVVAGALLYARALAPGRRERRWVLGIALALISLQAMLDYGLWRTPRPPWAPRLAAAEWRPQLTLVLVADVPSSRRMALALSPANLTASEQWHRTASAASSPWSA